MAMHSLTNGHSSPTAACPYCHRALFSSSSTNLQYLSRADGSCPHCNIWIQQSEWNHTTISENEPLTRNPPYNQQLDLRESATNANLTLMDSTTTASGPGVHFCERCTQNQSIVMYIMAEYIPDENDPRYNELCESAEQYRRELEWQYPPVCDDCQIQVQERLSSCKRYVKSRYFLSSLMQSRYKHQLPRPLLRRYFHPLIRQVGWCLGVSLWMGQWLLVNLCYLAWLNPEAIPDQVPNPCLSRWSSTDTDSRAVILFSGSSHPCDLVHPQDSIGVSLARAVMYYTMHYSSMWWPDYVECSIEVGFLIQAFIAGVIVIWTFDPTTLYTLHNVPGVVLYRNRYRTYQSLALVLYLASMASFHFHWLPNPFIAYYAVLLIPVYNILFLRSLRSLRIQFPATTKTDYPPPRQPTQPQFPVTSYPRNETFRNEDPEMTLDSLANLQLETMDVFSGHDPDQNPSPVQRLSVRKRTATTSSLDGDIHWGALSLTPGRKSTIPFPSEVPNHSPIMPPPDQDSPVPTNPPFPAQHMFSTGGLTGLEELFRKQLRLDDRWSWTMPASLARRIYRMVGWIQQAVTSCTFSTQVTPNLVSALLWLVTQRRERRYLLGPLALVFRLWATRSSFGQWVYLTLLVHTVAIYIYAVLQWWRTYSTEPAVKKGRNHLFFGRQTWLAEQSTPRLPPRILCKLGFSGVLNALAATLRIFWALAILLFHKRYSGYGYFGSPGGFPNWSFWQTWRAMESGLLFSDDQTMSGNTIAATPATPIYLPSIFNHPLLEWCASWLTYPWVGRFTTWLSYPVQCFLYFGAQKLPFGQMVPSSCSWCAEPTALALWLQVLALDFIWLSTLFFA